MIKLDNLFGCHKFARINPAYNKNIKKMSGNITLTIIKPDAVGKQFTGKIIDHIIQGGFRIRAMRDDSHE